MKSGGRFGPLAILLLAVLLVSPTLTVAKLRINPPVAVAYALLVNGMTYFVYASDKQRARQGDWRIPEVVLHSLELIGGWPGAFVAQRRLRHKCVKISYQIVFWIIVAVHQYVAFGFLQGSELPKAILRAIRFAIS